MKIVNTSLSSEEEKDSGDNKTSAKSMEDTATISAGRSFGEHCRWHR